MKRTRIGHQRRGQFNTIATLLFVLWFLLILVLIVWSISGLLNALSDLGVEMDVEEKIHQMGKEGCLAQGYPYYELAREVDEVIVYCIRTANGTSEVVPLNQLID